MIEIIVILDRSGSMGSVVSDAIGGFNSFLENTQRDTPDSRLTLVQFDDQYEVLQEGTSIREVPLLTRKTFVPRGSTALYDAIGRTLDDVGRRLDKTPVQQRPSKVIVAILTDGLENASTQYESKKIQEMIKHQTDVYSWEFVFLAANQDAIASGENIGVRASNAINMQSSSAGYQAVGGTLSSITSNVAMGQSVADMSVQRMYTHNVSNLEGKQEDEEDDEKFISSSLPRKWKMKK